MRGSGLIVFLVGSGILVVFFYYTAMVYSYLFSRPGLEAGYRDFYECGFKMIPDTHRLLDINFSLLGLIFLIYDTEIILLVPILVNAVRLPIIYILLAFVVIIILALSYWYEWERYGLQWGYS